MFSLKTGTPPKKNTKNIIYIYIEDKQTVTNSHKKVLNTTHHTHTHTRAKVPGFSACFFFVRRDLHRVPTRPF